MNGTTETHALRHAMQAVAPYPEGVLPVPEAIAGTAFFPGGHGLYLEDGPTSFPTGKVMVLGHDFHSEEQYEESRARGMEDLNAPTWRNLLNLLKEVHLAPTDCFFTNFFMGLREGTATTGVFPGKKDKDFVKRCQAFFLEQVAMQRPRTILVLGGQVPKLLAPLSPKLHTWGKAASLGSIDRAGAGLVSQVSFRPDLPPANLVALTHPSLRHANLRHRKPPAVVDAASYERELLVNGLA